MSWDYYAYVVLIKKSIMPARGGVIYGASLLCMLCLKTSIKREWTRDMIGKYKDEWMKIVHIISFNDVGMIDSTSPKSTMSPDRL